MEIHTDFVTQDMRATAITMKEVHRGWANTRGTLLLILGYPASRFEKTSGKMVTPEWLQWLSTALTKEELERESVRGDLRIGMDFDPTDGRDEKGQRKLSPKMSGVSGSGMWLLPPIGSATINGLPGKLTGIFTEIHRPRRPKYLVGTYVGVHMSLILRFRSDLKRFIL